MTPAYPDHVMDSEAVPPHAMTAGVEASQQILGTIRASSWPSLFDCAYRWYWQNIVGLKSHGSGFTQLGTAIHAGTAVFDTGRMTGRPVKSSDAVDVAVATVQSPEGEVVWDDDMTKREAEHLAVVLTARYCNDIAPRQDYVAVEVRCTSLEVATKHGVVVLTGTTDRVRRANDDSLGVSDFKSGGRATEVCINGKRRAVTKGHHLQLGVYTLMAEAELKQPMDAPAQIVGLQTTKEAPVALGEVADVKTPLLGTETAPGLIEIAAQMLKTGVFPPNPKSQLCSPKYCPGFSRCHFHD